MMDPAPQRPTLWRHPDFLKLWIGQTISVFGSQFTALALPLIAVVTLRATPADMGVLTAMQTAPFLLIGLFTGVWVDRLRRRPVLIAGDLGRAALLGLVPILALTGALRMTHLYVLSLLYGVLTVFFDVAYQAYLPSLVDRAQLVEGNTKLEASRSTAQVAGPGIAGVAIQALSAPLAIALDAVSFVISALFIGLIRCPEAVPHRAQSAMLAEVREGLGVVFGDPYLRAIAGCTGTSNFFGAALWSILILYATRELQLTPAAIGLIFSVANVGALAGAVMAGAAARRFGIGRVIVGGALLIGLGGLPIALATPRTAFVVLAFGWMIATLGSPIYNINQVSLRQAIVPTHLQGRLNATMRFLVWGTMPLGGLLGGFLGQALGLRPAIGIAAAGGVTAFLWVLRSPVRHRRRFRSDGGVVRSDGLQPWLRLAGGIFLCYLGLSTFMARPGGQAAASRSSGLAALTRRCCS